MSDEATTATETTPTPEALPPEAMTLLDLDGAGLDPRLPAPPEFIEFLYDNSRSGYLTLWSSILTDQDGPAVIQRWINDALSIYYSRSLKTQMAPPGDKPAGAHVTEVTYGGPTTMPAPVCIDVPMVTGEARVDATLSCSMGNWGNMVDGTYAYQWRADGANVGTDSAEYTVEATAAGMMVDCVVTATNVGGSTAAPPSNGVRIAGARQARSRREYPKEEVVTRNKEENTSTRRR